VNQCGIICIAPTPCQLLLFHENIKKNMYKLLPCPNQGCKDGKVHSIVGFDIFWNNCPICDGLGSIKRREPD
jgi:hypothetical protein